MKKREDLLNINNYLKQNQDQKAFDLVSSLLKKQKNNPILLERRGFIFLKNNQINLAKLDFEKAIELDKNFIDPIIFSGICEYMQRNISNAIKFFEKVLSLENKNQIALGHLGKIFFEKKFYKKSLEYYLKLLETDQFNDEYLKSIVRIFIELNDGENSYKYLNKINHKDHFYYSVKGNICAMTNNMDEAKLNYLKSIELKDDYIIAYFNLVTKTDFVFKQIHKDKLYKLLHENKSAYDRRTIFFTLGYYCERKKDYSNAYQFFVKGNLEENEVNPFNPHKIENDQKIKNNFYLKLLKKNIKINKTNKKLIFIIGMPRSGSTMLEQILSKNDKVYSIGESSIFDYLFQLIFNNFDNFEKIDETIQFFRKSMFERIDQYTNKKVIVEKSLFNFEYAGIIQIIFPESKIIHIKRNPIATCFSCFKINFRNLTKKFNFSTKIENLIIYYNFYLQTMKFWEENNISNLKTYNYEDLVDEPDKNFSKIFKFLDLNYDKKFLYINKKSFVKTASITQAREKIYKNSSLAWMVYKKNIKNLIEAFS